MRGEIIGQRGSWVSGREQEPSSGGHSGNLSPLLFLCCYLGPRTGQMTPASHLGLGPEKLSWGGVAAAGREGKRRGEERKKRGDVKTRE